MHKKILTIIGARPQFIKAAVVSRAITLYSDQKIDEVIVHTGQHHDFNMSEVFFRDLEIPTPKYNLGIAGGHHGAMTGQMLVEIEKVILNEKPDFVLVYGDTNSTLAGALAASKLHVPVIHVEAGLRSFNKKMPEEINRMVVDHVSDVLFCPTVAAVKNLKHEGIHSGVENVGDVMFDASNYYKNKYECNNEILENLSISKQNYALVTCHRAENTDNIDNLKEILSALEKSSKSIQVVFPMHPRTRNAIEKAGLSNALGNVIITGPMSYKDMIVLEANAAVIATDSGGVQKESYFYGVPCVTLRNETEWVETVELGWNQLVGVNSDAILSSILSPKKGKSQANPYGDGRAGEKIVATIASLNSQKR